MVFSPGERAVMAAFLILLVLGLGLWGWQQRSVARARAELAAYLETRTVPYDAETDGLPPNPDSGENGGSGLPGETRGPLLVVHVAGGVEKPGVYRLPPGARAAEAVEAAGGPTAEADLDALNLAAPLVDGQRLRVPVAGEAPGSGDETGVPGTGSGRVNVNTAGSAELQSIPGIGPVLAARILEYRSRNGPFRRAEDLTAVSGIGPRTLDSIRSYITTGND